MANWGGDYRLGNRVYDGIPVSGKKKAMIPNSYKKRKNSLLTNHKTCGIKDRGRGGGTSKNYHYFSIMGL